MYCALFFKTIFFAFLAINAWNRFSATPQETESFKKNLIALEQTLKNRIYPAYGNQVSEFLLPFAQPIVSYGSLTQLVFSVLAVWCSCCGSLAGLVYFVFQFITLNYLKIDFTNVKDLERYALPVSILIATLIMGCGGKQACGTSKSCPISKNDRSVNSEQATGKKRH